jgi:GNAT superfamily N-acetyltransferase
MTNTNLIIREADENDIYALASLMTELGYPTTDEEMTVRFKQILPHEDYQTYIAAVDNKVVGMVGLVKNFFYEKNGGYIRITALIVSKDSRGKGIGKALLTAAEQWALESSIHTIILNSGNKEERIPAHRFYEKNGYEHKSLGFVKNI